LAAVAVIPGFAGVRPRAEAGYRAARAVGGLTGAVPIKREVRAGLKLAPA